MATPKKKKETKPPSKPVSAKPAAEPKPQAGKPAASQPVDKRVGKAPAQSPPAPVRNARSDGTELAPVATKPMASKPVASKPVASNPVASAPAAPRGVAPTKPADKRAPVPLAASVSPAERHAMIERTAYYIAERAGFAGDPKAHWLAAEAEVNAQLTGA